MRPAGPPARALGLAAAGVAALVASRGFGTQALAVLGAGMVALPVLMTAVVWSVASGVGSRASAAIHGALSRSGTTRECHASRRAARSKASANL